MVPCPKHLSHRIQQVLHLATCPNNFPSKSESFLAYLACSSPTEFVIAIPFSVLAFYSSSQRVPYHRYAHGASTLRMKRDPLYFLPSNRWQPRRQNASCVCTKQRSSLFSYLVWSQPLTSLDLHHCIQYR